MASAPPQEATDITTALLACERPIVAAASPWSADPCLMFADQLDDSTSSEATTGVQFLAHEDTALKAYSQTRSRYLGGLPQRRAFNQIGEILPSVIIDGMLAGTWSWNAHTASVDVDLIAGRFPASVRRQVNARAAVPVEYAKVTTTMEPLSYGASLPGIQDYVARMETERGLDKQDLPSQCLKLG